MQSKGLSRVFSNTTVQNHQFFGAQLSSQSNSHFHTWPLEKPQRSWWWTGRPGMLRFMGSQRAGHDWATELNWINFFFQNTYTSILTQLFFPIHFYLRLFYVDFFFKVFIEFVTISLLFYDVLFWPQSMWDLSCPLNSHSPTALATTNLFSI